MQLLMKDQQKHCYIKYNISKLIYLASLMEQIIMEQSNKEAVYRELHKRFTTSLNPNCLREVYHPRKYHKKPKPLTQQQIEVFKQAFEIFDIDHSGSIDQSQMQALMTALGYNYSTDKIRSFLQQVDTDGSGAIELDEFIEFMSNHMLGTEQMKKQINKIFRHFDDDNSGFLDFKKIKAMASECFFKISDQSINAIIEACDIDADGKISRYEFFRIMKKVKLL